MAHLVKLAAMMSSVAFEIVRSSSLPVSIQDVVKHPSASRLGCKTHHAGSALNSLVKAGKLSRFKVGLRWMYELPIKKGAPVIKPLELPGEIKGPDQAAPAAPVEIPAGLQIQINKTTKILSLMYEGLRIEISVVG